MLFYCPIFALIMKILLAISLSLTVFFQSVGMEVSDILMLSDLVEHAKFHSDEYGDDLFTFFEKHYGELKAEHQATHQEEKPQHDKLPFQHHNCNHTLSEVILLGYEFPLKKPDVSFTPNHLFYYENLYLFNQGTVIFQPPKLS